MSLKNCEVSNVHVCLYEQRALFSQLSGGEEDFSSREAQLLVSILGVLSRLLEPTSQQVPIYTS